MGKQRRCQPWYDQVIRGDAIQRASATALSISMPKQCGTVRTSLRIIPQCRQTTPVHSPGNS